MDKRNLFIQEDYSGTSIFSQEVTIDNKIMTIQPDYIMENVLKWVAKQIVIKSDEVDSGFTSITSKLVERL